MRTMRKLPWMVWHNLATIVRDLWVNRLGGSVLLPYPLRWVVYRIYGIQAQTINIKSGRWFTGRRVRLGKGVFVNHGVLFDALGGIEVGDNCRLGMQVLLCTSTHELGGPEQRAGRAVGRPIVVGRGCWLGARVLVLPGVTIGEGCVVAAGAVVTSDCAPHGLYAGVPARRLRDLPQGRMPGYGVGPGDL